MIKVSNLSVDYGNNNGIFDIDLVIPNGEIIAIIGHSGCGKTTLLNTFAGLLCFDKGEIRINNEEIESASLGLIQQRDALFPWLKAWENVAIGINEDKKKKKNVSLSMLSELDMAEYAYAYPNQLSGGQRQRVSIARTLITYPDVLLMDEPTASLDAFNKESLQDLLLTLHQKKNRTTLFVTHSIEEALFLANKVLVMDKGRIIFTYENPMRHTLDLRDKPEFYDHVKKLRPLMKRGGLSE